jgi:sugar phosphate isomerase/epimerase
MYKLGINFDEISDDFSTAVEVMKECGVKHGELRTLNKKNFVFWSDSEVEEFKNKLAATEIELVAAATPLFKWYTNQDDPEVIHDNFGFNPRLDNEAKRVTITRVIDIAVKLEIPRLRIFSELGSQANAGVNFAKGELLDFALKSAQKVGIDLYLENEPVCKVHTKKEVTELLNANQSSNFKFWLDIANFIELDEKIDNDFLNMITPRLGYVHVKDFLLENGEKVYVPTGEGVINYKEILTSILASADGELVITIETHATDENKIEYSKRAIHATNLILKQIVAE